MERCAGSGLFRKTGSIGTHLDWLKNSKLDILFSPEMFYNRLNLKKKRGFEHEV